MTRAWRRAPLLVAVVLAAALSLATASRVPISLRAARATARAAQLDSGVNSGVDSGGAAVPHAPGYTRALLDVAHDGTAATAVSQPTTDEADTLALAAVRRRYLRQSAADDPETLALATALWEGIWASATESALADLDQEFAAEIAAGAAAAIAAAQSTTAPDQLAPATGVGQEADGNGTTVGRCRLTPG